MNRKYKTLSRFTPFLLPAILIIFMFIPTSIVYAQSEEPPAQTEGNDRWARRLAWLYQKELKLLDRQQERLENTAQVAGKVEEMISKAREKGLDVSALEAALQDYQAGVAEAQMEHNEAAEILETHAGFDENGNVTDIQAAKETVREAHKHLMQAHRTLEQNARQLRMAIRQWLREQRKDNQD